MAHMAECLGMAAPVGEEWWYVRRRLLDEATPLGRFGDTTVLRWQDPSGVRTTYSIHDDGLVEGMSSYAGEPGARLANVRMVDDDNASPTLAIADVVNEAGKQTLEIAVELEEGPAIRAAGGTHAGGLASVVGLANGVAVHADEHAFANSNASLLVLADYVDKPPPHVVEQGLPWPPRKPAEWCSPSDVFVDPNAPEAAVWLSGVVLRAERRTMSLTGYEFIVARVRTAGFEIDLCLPVSEHPEVPTAGQVIAGNVWPRASLGLLVPEGHGSP